MSIYVSFEFDRPCARRTKLMIFEANMHLRIFMFSRRCSGYSDFNPLGGYLGPGFSNSTYDKHTFGIT